MAKIKPINQDAEEALLAKSLDGGGNGGNNGGMEQRLAKVESDLEHIRTDVVEVKRDLRDLRAEVHTIRWWILTTAIGGVLAFIAAMIAFGQFQASWFQHSLNQNWEIVTKALDAVQQVPK